MLMHSGHHVGAWNFGPGSEGELTVQELAYRFISCWPALRTEPDNQLQPHEAAALRLNCDKALQELAWFPVWDIRTAIERTGAWYRTFHDSNRVQTADDIAVYSSEARRRGLAWAA
jgi:CDP-glucose 4,6-dehydratase